MREPFSYRSDPAVPKFPDDRPIIIFDGHCVMCSGFARFVLRHDAKIRPDAFTEQFTPEQFAGILFSLMLSAVVQQSFDPSAVLEIVRRTIY